MRKLWMVLRVALRALTRNKVRSFLTMLGVVIGVGAVIALVAAGEGARAQVVSQFESLGSNLLTVSPFTSFSFSRGGLQTSSTELTMADAEAIEALATSVALVAPSYSGNGTMTYAGETTSANITGVTAEYAAVNNWQLARGRFISAADDDNLAMVAVLGRSTVEDLFGSETVNPVGEIVRINRQNYEVIGVLESKGSTGPMNQDNAVMIPLRTAQLKLGGAGTKEVSSISVQVRSAEEMDLAQAQLTAILRARHGLETGVQDDFRVQNQEDIVSSVTETSGTFTTLLASIAAISLLVGGIGIMNIMLVSVTERTREVGLRKAVGAKRGDILLQFLAEAVVLSGIGGLIGVIFGTVAAQIITPMLGGTQALVTGESVILAVTVSLAIGVFFGLYPANRAARLNPIDALRYE
jgi:putative ABC transport system permease protein